MRRALPLPVVAALIFGVAAGAASAGSHGGAKRVNKIGPGTDHVPRDGVLGSPRWAIYEAANSRALVIPGIGGGGTLIARNIDGKVTKIRYPFVHKGAMSIVRSTLVYGAPPRLHGTAPPYNRHVYWWNLANGKSGVFIPKTGNYYVVAGPQSAIMRTPNGLVRRPLTGGHTSTPLEAPVGGTNHVVSGSDGFVVTDLSGHVSYQSWDDPGHYTTLTTAPAAPSVVSCNAPIGPYVACKVNGGQPELLRLDGGPPALVPVVDPTKVAEQVAASGSTLFWTQFNNATHSDELVSQDISSLTPAVASINAYFPTQTYGKVAVAVDSIKILIGTSATDMTTLVPPKPMRSAVRYFALGDNHVIWADDLRNTQHPAAQETTHRRSLAVHGHEIRLGPRKPVATTRHGDAYYDLFARGTTFAWRTDDGVLHIQYSRGRTAIANTWAGVYRPIIAVSSRWVVAEVGSGANQHLVVRDLTAKRPASSDYTIAEPSTWVTINGNTLATRNTDKSISLINLVTRKRRTVVHHSKNGTIIALTPTAMAWGEDTRGPTTIRDLRTGHTVISQKALAGANHQGFLLGNGIDYSITPLWLYSATGHRTKVLSKRYVGVIGISNTAVGWTDARGRLFVKPLA